MDKEVYPARSRSSMIGGDHQRAHHSFQVIAFTHFAHKRGKQALTCLPGEPEDINDLSCTLESAFERDILEAYTKLREL
ncbi:hypothetical protein ALC57_02813 [Trachymyrmex cornetzi]|uniref:Uncharacterized protein n=1 Tax=Trachymyrmex cornetzi TaxID=471704 RepID=A0A195EIR0_9HYME|nr:hypothetical protein ALC57_02813 [Trachymyrmex cornetzi]